MATLHVALHPLGAKHSVVERELFPRLETDYLVSANLELNPALLPAETAMRFDEALCGISRFVLPSTRRRVSGVWTKTVKERFQRGRHLSHAIPP
jgi:hypothetical protein